MSAGDTQPTQPIPDEWIATAEPPRRRRRAWPWIVAFAIVIGLAIVAWFAGEAIAKDLVTKTIREQVITQLSLPADQDIQVEVPGPMIPQLIVGTLGEVTITSEDVPMESFVGDVTVTAQDIPIRGEGEMGSAAATVVLTEEQLRTLMSTVEDFAADSLGLAAPDVTMSTEVSVFGVGIPVGVSLTPSAVDGDLVLTPASLQLAGAAITAEDLRRPHTDGGGGRRRRARRRLRHRRRHHLRPRPAGERHVRERFVTRMTRGAGAASPVP
jgi:hypothetical protein